MRLEVSSSLRHILCHFRLGTDREHIGLPVGKLPVFITVMQWNDLNTNALLAVATLLSYATDEFVKKCCGISSRGVRCPPTKFSPIWPHLWGFYRPCFLVRTKIFNFSLMHIICRESGLYITSLYLVVVSVYHIYSRLLDVVWFPSLSRCLTTLIRVHTLFNTHNAYYAFKVSSLEVFSTPWISGEIVGGWERHLPIM
jgi:hypothetical protein